MKNREIIRVIDELGRVSLPLDLRKDMGIDSADKLKIIREGDAIVLRKLN